MKPLGLLTGKYGVGTRHMYIADLHVLAFYPAPRENLEKMHPDTFDESLREPFFYFEDYKHRAGLKEVQAFYAQ